MDEEVMFLVEVVQEYEVIGVVLDVPWAVLSYYYSLLWKGVCIEYKNESGAAKDHSSRSQHFLEFKILLAEAQFF